MPEKPTYEELPQRALEKPVGMLEMAGAVHELLSGEDHGSGDG